MTQLVKCLTLGFGSGNGLAVRGSSPTLGSALTVWSLLGILSAPPPACSFSLSVSVSQIKREAKKES